MPPRTVLSTTFFVIVFAGVSVSGCATRTQQKDGEHQKPSPPQVGERIERISRVWEDHNVPRDSRGGHGFCQYTLVFRDGDRLMMGTVTKRGVERGGSCAEDKVDAEVRAAAKPVPSDVEKQMERVIAGQKLASSVNPYMVCSHLRARTSTRSFEGAVCVKGAAATHGHYRPDDPAASRTPDEAIARLDELLGLR